MRTTLFPRAALILISSATVFLSGAPNQLPAPAEETMHVFFDGPAAPDDLAGLWKEADLVALGTVTSVRSAIVAVGSTTRMVARTFTFEIAERFNALPRDNGSRGNPVDVMLFGGTFEGDGRRLTTVAVDQPDLTLHERYVLFLRWNTTYQAFLPSFGRDSVLRVRGDAFDVPYRTPALTEHLNGYTDLNALLQQLRILAQRQAR